MRDGLRDARNLCLIDVIAFLCERRKSLISFADFGGKVKISTKSLKRRAELLSHLKAPSLKRDGKTAALPPVVYAVYHTVNESEERLQFPEEGMYHQRLQYHNVVIIEFVDKGDVTEVFEDHREEQIDEYETDSNDEESDFQKHSELVK